MSLLLKTIRAFPRGRTTDELMVLAGAAFAHDKRIAALAELDQLLAGGQVIKGRDGRWRPAPAPLVSGGPDGAVAAGLEADMDLLMAAPAQITQIPASDTEPEDTAPLDDARIDPQALLRYWRSALRADPRGAISQASDTHGIEWTLICGQGVGDGPVTPDAGQSVTVTVPFAGLPPTFQEALMRREGTENALAIGWPMAVGRQHGAPVFQPVGMVTASWQRQGDALVLSVDADDVLVNPEWVRSAARPSGWSRDALADLFHADTDLGLRTADFIEKLRSAVASQMRGPVTGAALASQINP
ncbi:MAG: hypothetical protein ACPG7W_08640, partial [Paracoccaceae bacterium]